MKATQRLISIIWTVEYEKVSEGKVRILSYTNTDPEGYTREKELAQCELIETEDRIVTHLWLKPYDNFDPWVNTKNVKEKYEVINPQHIFSYDPGKK
ncbi:hypothetical protein [Chryseobacterium sp. HMWF035]|uniref:hypothetical protein n=1 Tax=Chryseobacterium sp. HMWF035 TaxID=2056868 RepID=UPI000D57AA19|nr:hypothetical protein [Chryseobacterium sp. HMWF035]PVV50445.1 hypothetical protein DD829_22545 [Chryseobacterium sp. HMWF035]